MIKSSILLFCLSLATLSGAQYGDDGDDSSSSLSKSTSSAITTASASSAIHTVDVGEEGLVFEPDSLRAGPGDKIEFHFYPGGHSVVQAAFDNPCRPMSDTSFYSGTVSTSSDESHTIFTLTVNDTNPIWFYCGQSGHCTAGMVGVINPPPSGPETLDAFKEAASMASSESVPAHVQGGILSTEEEEAPSTTSPASGTPTNGGSPSGTASPTPSAPNDAKRLQFSIELGVVSVFTLMVAGVLM